MRKKLIPMLMIWFVLLSSKGYSQCSASTPSFVVDLSSSPTATWTSPSVIRDGNCCADNNCVAFLITLHPAATEISLTISSGAIPTGALFYQIGCGGLQSVGATACISGTGPHLITFCKPGNNVNTYTIASNPISASPDFTMTETTSASMFATGLTSGTINWTSIFPAPIGAYNSYLSCTTCSNPTITAPLGAPPLVRYMVSGSAVSGCLPLLRYDTVNVTILDLPLPVELLSFEGAYDNNNQFVDLTWSTVSETNNELFKCERSENGIDWDVIGIIHSKGSSNELKVYEFTDTHPLDVQQAYYRLVQRDWNGNERMYDPITVIKNQETAISYQIFPNPNNGEFYIQFNRVVTGVMNIIDNSGKSRRSSQINSSYQQIQADDLAPGCYTVELIVENKSYYSKIIVQ
jgi:hypothetical protein